MSRVKNETYLLLRVRQDKKSRVTNCTDSFSTLLFLSPLTLSNRSVSFFSLLILSHHTLSNTSASFGCRMQETLYQTSDAVVSLLDRRCRRHSIGQVCRSFSIRQRMQETLYSTAVAGVSLSDIGCRSHSFDRQSPASAV